MKQLNLAVNFAIMAIAFVPAISFAAGAVSPTCESGDKAAWMSTEVIIEKAAELGFTVESVAITDGNCYYATSTDSDGDDIDLFFDPLTGEKVEGEEPAEG